MRQLEAGQCDEVHPEGAECVFTMGHGGDHYWCHDEGHDHRDLIIERSVKDATFFGSWLMRTARLQRESYATDPEALEGDEFAEFLRFNALAAYVELGEALQHIPWKPWAKRRGRPVQQDRRDIIEEYVDVLHFIGNMLVALRVTDHELSTEYERKMSVNRKRMADGQYQGRTAPAPPDAVKLTAADVNAVGFGKLREALDGGPES